MPQTKKCKFFVTVLHVGNRQSVSCGIDLRYDF